MPSLTFFHYCGSRRATWGPSNGDVDVSWQRAATTTGNRIHAVHPDLLVMVGGLEYSTELAAVRTLPVVLSVPNRVVYVAHDYPWFYSTELSYEAYAAKVDANWGYIAIEAGENFTAPVFVSEFGTCHTGMNCIAPTRGARTGSMMDNGLWFQHIQRYMRERDFDFAYWPLNGSTCKGTDRVTGTEETYGLLNVCWNAYVFPPLLEALQALQAPSNP